MFTWATTLTGALVGSGAVLVVAGLRGRRIDDHPICRACGFDVVGLGGGEAELGICPECGAKLNRAGATRTGRRRRSRRTISIGAVMIAFGLAFGVLVVQPGAIGGWLQQRMPTGWLVAQAELGSADAARELAVRWQAASLSQKERDRVNSLAITRLMGRLSTPFDRRIDDAGWWLLYAEVVNAGTITPKEEWRIIAATVRVEHPEIAAEPPAPGMSRIGIAVLTRGIAVPMVGDVFWRFEDQEIQLGKVGLPINATTDYSKIHMGALIGVPDDFPADDLSVLDVVIELVDGRSIVFEDVPIRRVAPADLMRWEPGPQATPTRLDPSP